MRRRGLFILVLGVVLVYAGGVSCVVEEKAPEEDASSPGPLHGADLHDDAGVQDGAEPDDCVPDCTNSSGDQKACGGKECGPDGLGGYCGTGEASTQGCPDDSYNCVNAICIKCVPDCAGKECGPDGCGGSCGICPCPDCDPNAVDCSEGVCNETPECDCKCIFDCFETCPAGDQACSQNCVNSATIEGQEHYNALITCLDSAGYFACAEGDQECLDAALAACTEAYYDCFAGDLECVDMYLCLISCPGGDAGEACAQECFGEGSIPT